MPGRLYRSLPRHFLLFHPLIFPWILLESRQKYAISLRFLRSFLPRKRKKKKRCSNDVSNIECWNCCLCFRFFLFFNVSIKISLLVRKRRDKKTKFVNFSSLFFFSPFSINFNSSFQKHLSYVIASNVWNYRMFADARAN